MSSLSDEWRATVLISHVTPRTSAMLAHVRQYCAIFAPSPMCGKVSSARQQHTVVPANSVECKDKPNNSTVEGFPLFQGVLFQSSSSQ